MIIEKVEKEQAIELDLSGRGLTQLPKKIAMLKNLKVLDLSNNKLEYLPKSFTQLKNLKTLDLSYNDLSDLPKEFVHLRELTQLNLSYNKLAKLPEEVIQLRNLTQFYLANNHLRELPKEIGQLQKLRWLDLSYNNLSLLPGEIGQIVSLTQLFLKGNMLKELPKGIARLGNLVQLNLNSNQLRKLPREIGQLKSLTQLYLMENRLNVLPDEIVHLGNLRQLDLKKNHIRDLPKGFSRLRHLTFLNLSFNQIIEMPEVILQLRNLIYLHLSFNQIIELPKEIARLENLFYLDVRYNLLNELPREITRLGKLKRLETDDNPLVSPPVEIVSQGLSAILDYLRKMGKGGQTLYEGKLLIVGQGGVGKTSLMKRLTRNEYSEDEITTEGIDIHHWEIMAEDESKTRMSMNLWDFGGQEIYHATHQFFLTRRSLYLLVWDARQEEEYGRIDYWLKTIETFAMHSPILLVMNKSDERIKHLNFKDLKQRCPQLVVSGRVSAKKAVGIRSLRKLIRKEAWNLPLMGTFWPPSWLNVRRALETDTRHHMPYGEYLMLCRKHDIKTSEAGTLSRYLHDLGIILHFHSDELLRDTIILKPEWGTDAVYKVLDADVLRERNGVLHERDLPDIWADQTLYPKDKYATILRLMAHFELAFPIGEKDCYVVVGLLSEKEIEYDWNPESPLTFEYHYDFLPAGLITRVIVRMHAFVIEQNGKHLCWREGAYLEYREARAMIRANPYTKIAIIEVQGGRHREFLAIIRSHFDAIHNKIKKLSFEEKVPCICYSGCEHRFDYNFLLKCEEKRKPFQTCQISIEDVSVEDMLDKIEKSETRRMRTYEERKDRYPADDREMAVPDASLRKKWYFPVIRFLKNDKE